MAINFNGTNLTSVVYNGTTCTTVIYNGTTVFPSAPPAGPTITYIANNTNLSSLATYTFTAQSIGGPGLIVVSSLTEGPSSGVPTFTATINGSAMTTVVSSSSNNSNGSTAYIFSGRVASGTTANIVITRATGSNPLRLSIGVWRIEGNVSDTAQSSAAIPENSSGNGTFSANLTGLTVGAKGVIGSTEGTGGSTISYNTGPTDFNLEINPGGAGTRINGGNFTAAAASTTVSLTVSGNSQSVACATAAWF